MNVLRISLLLFCVLSSVPAGAEDFPFLAEITSDSVNLRAGQSTNYEALGQLDKGTKLIVVGRNYDWYKVKLPLSAKSFIHSQYIKVLHSGIGEVIGNHVRVRAGGGDKSSSLGQLNKGDKVRILEKVGDWYRIEPVEGLHGWISEQFLVFKSKEVPAPQAVVLPPRNVYPRVEESPKPQEAEKIFTASGTLDLDENLEATDIQYKLLLKDSGGYTVQGGGHILKEFLHAQVKVDGVLDPATSSSAYPVIRLRRISLVL